MAVQGTAGTARPDGRATRWAGHREQRRREMVEVAVRVIERDGPAASVDQIAAEIGVGRQVLYRQFDDRADLDGAIAERGIELLLDDLLPAVARAADGETGGDARIHDGLLAYLDHVERHPAMYRFLRSYDSSRQGGPDPVQRVKELLATLLAEKAGTGQPDAATRVLAVGIIGLAEAVVDDWLDHTVRPSRDEVLAQLAVMVRGVGALAGRPPAAPAPRTSPEAAP
jgi:AcrR family transcriptional regulator